MTPAIVLAAGASTRMGRPKAMLQAGDRTFIRTILDTLREAGIPEAVVVVRPGQDAVIAEVAASGFGRAVLNPQADQGQLSSLIAGLDAIDRDGVDAALVTLVDVPLIQASTIRQLLARAAASPAPILRAVHRGRHGHPVIFKRQLFDALRHADPALGAKAIVRGSRVENVEVTDPAVMDDIDTPADYTRVFDMQAGSAQHPEKFIWYHTIELPGGATTPGIYDHRPYVPLYGLPPDLHGKSVLDVGAASGFFTFELEGRGGAVTATDLPTWRAHDFGAHYQPELAAEQADEYLHEPFLFAHHARGSQASRKLTSIYDISPETTGVFDLVFCGSVLIHLTDPATALRRLQSVTREAAIISTVVYPLEIAEPVAMFTGHLRGDTWWAPNRAGFEALVRSAGFAGWEWYSEFSLDYADGTPGPYHAVIRAWNTPERPAMLGAAGPSPRPPQPAPPAWQDRLAAHERELSRLHRVIDGYKAMKFVRLVQWLHPYRQRIRGWFG
jgi:CTP:molybdopterin cytidylyltransferase MocA